VSLGILASCFLVGWGERVQGSEANKYVAPSAARNGLLGFGTAVSDSDIAFGGAPAGTRAPGFGYLFNLNTGNVLRTLTPSVAPNDNLFGFNSRMHGNRLLVGDPANPFARTPLAGAAYVFDVTTGNELFRLQPNDSFGGDEFGFGINLYENLAGIGAPNLGEGSGAAYLFDIQSGNQIRKLVPSDPLNGSEFGADLALNDRFTVVGAPANFDTLGYFPGAAYVFDTQTGNQLYKLRPNDSFGGNEFGFDVAIDGSTAIIGSPSGGADIGAAYLFDLNTGQQLFKLTPTDNVAGNDFGSAVDIVGNTVIVGASGLSALPGAVYLFNALTGQQIEKLQPSDLETGDAFGISVAAHGNRLLVGSARDDDTNLNAGALYLFDLPTITLPGDFNLNGELDVNDLDLLTLAVFNGSTNLAFDLDGNGVLGQGDRKVWVNDLKNTFFGDANLDGQFNTGDLIHVLIPGLYEDNIPNNATWATGDWDGDLDFGTGDLIIALQDGGYEQGPRAAVAAVPEPNSMILAISLLPLALRRVAVRRFQSRPAKTA
jgi:outer membrane protein assembly factor BamB